MNDAPSDALSRWWWALRTYAWVVLLAVVALAAAGAAAARAVPSAYEATALVVARTLEVDAELLPRLTSAVWQDGRVVERAIESGALALSPDELREAVEVEAYEENIAIRVRATAGDPQAAAAVANTVADTLVTDLNRLGPGVGVFTVHAPARAPDEPSSSIGLPVAIAVGALAGLVLAVGVVGLLASVKRPVLSPGEASAIADVPVLGSLRVPKRGHRDPTEIHGLSALVKRIVRRDTRTVAFVGPDARSRHQTSVLVARAIARRTPTVFVPVAADPVPPALQNEESIVVSEELAATSIGEHWPVIVDGPMGDELDMPQFLPGDASVVLVVPRGASTTRLRTLASLFLPGEIVGLVYVDRVRRRHRRRSGARDVRSAAHVERTSPDASSAR